MARASLTKHLIAISQRTCDDLVRELKVRRRKVTTIHLGVDTDIFNPRASDDDARIWRKYALPERGFLCVSSDHYRKNHRTLFEAWCEAAASIPEGLVFVGRALYGTTLQELERDVNERQLAARFRWLQDVPDHELPAIYRWAHGTVAPSLYEGFGMTLLESMASGTPVVAARNGAYEEVGGDAVLTFTPTSTAELADRLRQLSRDMSLHAALVERGVERARRFTWARMAEQTLAVYLQCLGAPSRVVVQGASAGDHGAE